MIVKILFLHKIVYLCLMECEFNDDNCPFLKIELEKIESIDELKSAIKHYLNHSNISPVRKFFNENENIEILNFICSFNYLNYIILLDSINLKNKTKIEICLKNGCIIDYHLIESLIYKNIEYIQFLIENNFINFDPNYWFTYYLNNFPCGNGMEKCFELGANLVKFNCIRAYCGINYPRFIKNTEYLKYLIDHSQTNHPEKDKIDFINKIVKHSKTLDECKRYLFENFSKEIELETNDIEFILSLVNFGYDKELAEEKIKQIRANN